MVSDIRDHLTGDSRNPKMSYFQKINKLAGPGRPKVLKVHNSLKTDSWWLNLTKWVFKENRITTVKLNKFDTFQ